MKTNPKPFLIIKLITFLLLSSLTSSNNKCMNNHIIHNLPYPNISNSNFKFINIILTHLTSFLLNKRADETCIGRFSSNEIINTPSLINTLCSNIPILNGEFNIYSFNISTESSHKLKLCILYSIEQMTYAFSTNTEMIKAVGKSFGGLLGISRTGNGSMLSLDEDSTITIGYSFSRQLKYSIEIPIMTYIDSHDEILYKKFIFSGEFYLKISLFTEKYYDLFYIKSFHVPSIFTYSGEAKVLVDVNNQETDVVSVKEKLFDDMDRLPNDDNHSISMDMSSIISKDNENSHGFLKDILNSHSLCIEINGSISFNLFGLTKGILPSLTLRIKAKLIITVNDEELGTGLYISLSTNDDIQPGKIQNNESLSYNQKSYINSFSYIFKYLGVDTNVIPLETSMGLFINETYIGVKFTIFGMGVEFLYRISDERLSIKFKTELFTVVKKVGMVMIYKVNALFDVSDKFIKSFTEKDYNQSLISEFASLVKKMYMTCDEMSFIIQNKVYDYILNDLKDIVCFK